MLRRANKEIPSNFQFIEWPNHKLKIENEENTFINYHLLLMLCALWYSSVTIRQFQN